MGTSQKPATTTKEFTCRTCPHSTPRDGVTIFCRIREHAIPANAPCCGFRLIPWDAIPWYELPWTPLGAKFKREQEANPKRKTVHNMILSLKHDEPEQE